MEADSKVPLILGRPFFTTGKAITHVEKNELVMMIENKKKIKFDIFKSPQLSHKRP